MGVFITLEGGEGTGKSTQARLLKEYFARKGIDAVFTREPGGTPQAERIRDILLQRDSGSFDPMTEALLLFAGRREHLVNKILPALAKGQWVVSDRFADSSRAFQGYGMGLDMAVIDGLYKMVAGGFEPDLTLIFDIDPKIGLGRSMERLQAEANTEDRYERMDFAFHERLRQGYLDIAKRFPKRCVVIDGAQGIDALHTQIVALVEERFHA